jgi:hypothetical protein
VRQAAAYAMRPTPVAVRLVDPQLKTDRLDLAIPGWP